MKTIVYIAILGLSIVLFNCSSKNTIARQEFPPSEIDLVRIQRDTSATLDSLARSQILNSPFGPTTGMEFTLAEKDSVSIKLYDVLGSSVTKTYIALLNSGRYRVKLNSLGLNSGVYYFRLAIGSKVQTKRIIILN
jgi:hypothetical protein